MFYISNNGRNATAIVQARCIRGHQQWPRNLALLYEIAVTVKHIATSWCTYYHLPAVGLSLRDGKISSSCSCDLRYSLWFVIEPLHFCQYSRPLKQVQWRISDYHLYTDDTNYLLSTLNLLCYPWARKLFPRYCLLYCGYLFLKLNDKKTQPLPSILGKWLSKGNAF